MTIPLILRMLLVDSFWIYTVWTQTCTSTLESMFKLMVNFKDTNTLSLEMLVGACDQIIDVWKTIITLPKKKRICVRGRY